ncbi:1,4-dihydroxy-2-naphthoyl-CoA synthase [Paraconexibacter sp. AEG42_29]|uniref:1,4-dihydroxy-2-naphthoyl-CoA synthase n=1 Tax=Paraconexibacter sp. AEG42_29 TaxID=2997339 RepID=A0AAU7ATB7_9ACTN
MSLLEYERPDARIAVLRLNRPEVRNAMDRALLAALEERLAELAADEALGVLVISTTNTRALCAGADVGEALSAEEGVERMEAFARFYSAIEAFPAVTIAVATGNCVGAGAELVAGCDLRVGADNLKLAWAGARLGVPVGPARLLPLVGMSVAKDLVFTGRVVGADEALRLALLHRLTPEAEVEAAALELAQAVAANNGPGLRHLKRRFHAYADLAACVDDENGELVAFQREGGGLPQGGGRG